MAKNINNINESNSKEYDRGYQEAIQKIKEQLQQKPAQGNSGGSGGEQPDPRLIMPINSNNGGGEQGENQDKQRKNVPNNRTMDVGKKNEMKDSYNKEHGNGKSGENGDKGKDSKDGKDGQGDKGSKGNDKGNKNNKSNGNDSDGTGDPNSFSGGDMVYNQDIDDIEGDEWDAKEGMSKLVNEYAGKVGGVVGQFVAKCDDALDDIKGLKQQKSGMTAYATRANSAPWDVQIQQIIDKYISARVRKSNHKERTYYRPNRRSGPAKVGEPLKKGTRNKKDKMLITMTFYIDISGSMVGNPVRNAFNSAYKLSDFILKKFKNNANVNDCLFDYYAFNTKFHKVKPGTIPHATGDNVDFDQILTEIKNKSLNDLVNIIITDARFPIPLQKTVDAVKNSNGMYIVVINNTYSLDDLEAVKRKVGEKFVYILADEEFNVSI